MIQGHRRFIGHDPETFGRLRQIAGRASRHEPRFLNLMPKFLAADDELNTESGPVFYRPTTIE